MSLQSALKAMGKQAASLVRDGSLIGLGSGSAVVAFVVALGKAVEELYDFVISLGGDIARLGEERVVLTPPGVRVWRGAI